MNIPLELNNYAIAADGGSICLIFTINESEDLLVRLDQGIVAPQ